MSSPRMLAAFLVLLVGPLAAEEPKQIQVKLVGTITDPDGNPIQYAQVSGNFRREKSAGNLHTHTNKQGEYTLDVYTGDTVFLDFHLKELVAEPVVGLEIGDPTPQMKVLPRVVIDRQLQRGKRIAGRVVWGTDKRPAERHGIQLHRDESIPGESDHRRYGVDYFHVRWMETDKDGQYEFFAPPGRYVMQTAMDRAGGDRREEPIEITSESPETILDFHARRPEYGQLFCKVVDTDSQPVSGVAVYFGRGMRRTDEQGVAYFERRGIDANLAFARRHAASEEAEKTRTTPPVVGNDPSSVQGEARLVGPETESVTLTLKKPITIRGRLLNVDTDEPFAEAWVQLRMGEWNSDDCSNFLQREKREKIPVDADGRFEFRNVLTGGTYLLTMQTSAREKTGKQEREITRFRFLGSLTPFRDTDVDLGEMRVAPPIERELTLRKPFVPDSPERFVERLGTALETAALTEKRVLLFFSDYAAKSPDRYNTQRQTCTFYQYELTPYVVNPLFKDVLDRYELVAQEVPDFANPPEEIAFITEQLNVDLSRESSCVLCILDDTGKCLKKRSLAELGRPDDPGAIDPAMLFELLNAP